jgi:hypothetical protein
MTSVLGFQEVSFVLRPRGLHEFGVTAVFEEKLQVFGIKPELMKRSANLIGHGCRRRRTGPTVRPAGVFEAQFTTIGEVNRSLSKRQVRNILRRMFSRIVGKVHRSRLQHYAATWPGSSSKDFMIDLYRQAGPAAL